jgi:hypothetical protein
VVYAATITGCPCEVFRWASERAVACPGWRACQVVRGRSALGSVPVVAGVGAFLFAFRNGRVAQAPGAWPSASGSGRWARMTAAGSTDASSAEAVSIADSIRSR